MPWMYPCFANEVVQLDQLYDTKGLGHVDIGLLANKASDQAHPPLPTLAHSDAQKAKSMQRACAVWQRIPLRMFPVLSQG